MTVGPLCTVNACVQHYECHLATYNFIHTVHMPLGLLLLLATHSQYVQMDLATEDRGLLKHRYEGGSDWLQVD